MVRVGDFVSFINKELLIQRATSLNSNTEAGRQYYGSIYNMIINMPDEEVEKITHGHWYGVSHYQDKASGQCSECKKRGILRTDRDDWGLWYIDMPRCPNCGAIMDGKVNYI